MLKNILLVILALINAYFIYTLSTNYSINLLSAHIISAGFAIILSILFLITRVASLTRILAALTIIITSYHIYLIVMVIYNYVYVK